MKKHKNLFLSLAFLALAGVLMFVIYMDFFPIMGSFLYYAHLPLLFSLALGFFVSWIIDIFKKSEISSASWVIFSLAVLGMVLTSFISFWDIAVSEESLYPGFYGLFIYMITLPNFVFTAVISAAIIRIRKYKQELKEQMKVEQENEKE